MSSQAPHWSDLPRGPSRFKLAVKPRSAPRRPYAWEIYDDEEDQLLHQSKQRFRTFGAAWEAGSVVLDRMIQLGVLRAKAAPAHSGTG
jgi:hypothetical protein